MITKQWHGVQFQQFKLTTSLPKCLNGHPSVHLRSFRPISGRNKEQARLKTIHCKAGLAEDAPFAIAIGACVLNSIIFHPRDKPNDQDGENMDDVRYAAMGIISFIPYFNWLSWVFAWLDTGRRQYLVYAVVYLAPYIRYFYQHFFQAFFQRARIHMLPMLSVQMQLEDFTMCGIALSHSWKVRFINITRRWLVTCGKHTSWYSTHSTRDKFEERRPSGFPVVWRYYILLRELGRKKAPEPTWYPPSETPSIKGKRFQNFGLQRTTTYRRRN